MWSLLLLFAAFNVLAAKELLVNPSIKSEMFTASWVIPCYRDDPGFNECALKNGREALPKLFQGDKKFRTPSLDPLEATELHVDKDATKLGIDMRMKNVKVYGLAKLELRDYRVDFEKKHISYIGLVPVLNLICSYELSGQILVLPIRGKGPANFTLIDTVILYGLDYDLEKKKNGKEHMVLKDYKMDLKPAKSHIRLENLFDGNKLLADNMNAFLEENSQEMVNDVGPAVSEALALIVKQIFNKLVATYSFDEIHPLKPK